VHNALPQFMVKRPGLSVELTPIDTYASPVPEVDVRILWVAEGEYAPSPTQAPLFCERVFPVCHPRLLAKGQPWRDPQALAQMTLLHKTTMASGEWHWDTWLERLGIDARLRRGGELRFAELGPILSAALEGAGVALARSLLVHDALHSGRLTLPVLGFEPMTSVKKHVARWRRNRVDDPDITAFVGWMVEEAALTLARTDAWLHSTLSAAPASAAADHAAPRTRPRVKQRATG
jgi:LysR family transcriptional regulator, glycine cleavage system transcriptional activator